ncbi:MAG: ABC transporter permease, partial [Cyclobacteriaceae bacterium]
FVVLGCHAALMVIRAYELAKGRFLDPLDRKEKRRVAVIGQRVKDVLFGNVDPIGKEIQITGSTYTVIGMLKDRDNRWENKRIIVPLSTAQVAYGKGNDIQSMMFTVNTSSVPATLMAEQTIRNVIAEKHRFSPNDEKALRVENVLEEYNRWMAVFGGIKIFLGVVGVFTLLAGIVGISNIMLIIAQERTREIGVRKALGATPRSIVGLFLMEAMIITIISGYLGLLGGALFVTKGGLLNMMLNFGFPEDFFGDPSIDLIIVLSATAILIAAGSLAGYFPARRASLIQPVEALKDE